MRYLGKGCRKNKRTSMAFRWRTFFSPESLWSVRTRRSQLRREKSRQVSEEGGVKPQKKGRGGRSLTLTQFDVAVVCQQDVGSLTETKTRRVKQKQRNFNPKSAEDKCQKPHINKHTRTAAWLRYLLTRLNKKIKQLTLMSLCIFPLLCR